MGFRFRDPSDSVVNVSSSHVVVVPAVDAPSSATLRDPCVYLPLSLGAQRSVNTEQALRNGTRDVRAHAAHASRTRRLGQYAPVSFFDRHFRVNVVLVVSTVRQHCVVIRVLLPCGCAAGNSLRKRGDFGTTAGHRRHAPWIGTVYSVTPVTGQSHMKRPCSWSKWRSQTCAPHATECAESVRHVRRMRDISLVTSVEGCVCCREGGGVHTSSLTSPSSTP